MSTLVGALGHQHRALVDERGGVAPTDAAWELRWWIGADDRWRVPAREASVRQTLIEAAPVVQTAMRVPAGDAVHRVFGVAGAGDPIIVEVENASPAPFVVAFVASGVSSAGLDGSTVILDGGPALVSTRAPSRWSCAVGSTEVEVLSGAARSGAFPPVRNRGGRLEVAVLYPVPHRATVRVALPGRRAAPVGDVTATPDAGAVAHGWRAQVERGMTIELPDERFMDAIRAALAETLLAATGGRPDAAALAALEDWGFDDEVATAWPRLSWRQRRVASHRSPAPVAWSDVVSARVEGGPALLLAVRSLLAHEAGEAITILSDLPEEWQGASIDVRGAPTRRGPLSFSVRWHGERAALLWESPGGVTLQAPSLDPAWSTSDPSGEALLG